jgi:hypothetical protein
MVVAMSMLLVVLVFSMFVSIVVFALASSHISVPFAMMAVMSMPMFMLMRKAIAMALKVLVATPLMICYLLQLTTLIL